MQGDQRKTRRREVEDAEAGGADPTAFASMTSNTGWSSPGELLMTSRTSEVAVCCSSASESSRVRACAASNSWAFSIAITAWDAKVSRSLIWLSVKGRTALRPKMITPIGVPSRKRGTPSMVWKPPCLVIPTMVYSGSA